ncbi:hypothetical protein RCC89_15355 [Cytophagaceae bacterium ABcell3]|nr:hypothetical protein RCC89_15355 [Cytophagaceae bacterium ABcell3]
MKKYITILIFLSCATQYVCAQDSRNPTRFLEIGGGPAAYRGDLTPRFERWSGMVHLGLKLNFKERFNSHVTLLAGNVEGQNINYFSAFNHQYPAADYFKTRILSLNYNLQFHLIKTDQFMLWVSQGVGLLRFSPRDAFGEDLLSRTDTRAPNEDFSNVSLSFPTTLGAAYFFPNHYGIGLQAGLLNPMTDYIDNISQLSKNPVRDNVLMLKMVLMVPITYE